MRGAHLGSVITAIATPFGEDGEVDFKNFEALASWLVEHGSDGIVVTGSTGEASTLSDSEKVELYRIAKSAVGEKVVIAGATGSSTEHSVELVKQASKAGVDAVLAVTPYYNRPSQEGLHFHFGKIIEVSELPVILYDIPIRTGRKIAPETTLKLFNEHENLVGVKDAAQNVAESAKLIRDTSGELRVYSGDDALTLPLMSVGAAGVISVASHWAGPVFAEMVRAYFEGNVKKAADLNRAIMPSFGFQSQEAAPNPEPLKAVLSAMGLALKYCRPPMMEPSDELIAAARSLLNNLVVESKELGVILDSSWTL